MWQRIQTLYLLISTLLSGLMLFCDKAKDVAFTEYVPYLVLIIVMTLLNVLALTTYKLRIFQMRTANLSAIIALALQVWLVVDYFTTRDVLTFNITALFPLAVMILNFLASRSIYADELLVRSASRLRSSKHKK